MNDALQSFQVTVVVTERSRYLTPMWSEFGLSLLIDAKLSDGTSTRILYDTSTSGDLLLRNLGYLGVQVGSIEYVVLSHAHYDHTGGLVRLLLADDARFTVIAHPEIRRPVYSTRRGIRFIGLDPAVLAMLPPSRLVLSEDPYEVCPGVRFTGTVPRRTPFEKPEVGVATLKEGRMVPDPELDDAALVLDVGQPGIAVVTGCAHAGVINTVLHAKDISGSPRIAALIGGFHLVDLENTVRVDTVEALKELDPSVIYSGHCTGPHAEGMLYDAFGDRYNGFCTGDCFLIPGDNPHAGEVL